MATSTEYIEFVCGQILGTGEIRYKKMFGEYMIYVDDKPVFTVCDNTVYVKKFDEIKEKMQGAEMGCPYNGAKEQYILDIDNAKLSKEVVRKLKELIPVPKSKKKKNKSIERKNVMCEFCKIINKQIPAHIVYENKNIIVFLDIEPINEGHVLVVPKEHTDSIDKISDEVLLDIIKTIQKVVVALREIYGMDGYSIMQNGDKFCDFGHAHFHVFPRYENDGFGFIYPEGEFEYSAAVAERLRNKLADEMENIKK